MKKFKIVYQPIMAFICIIHIIVGCTKSDPIPKDEIDNPVKNFEVEFRQSSFQLEIGQTAIPGFTILNYHPNLDDYPELVWESSNTNIAVVDGKGNVTGIAVGKAKISLKLKSSSKVVYTDVDVIPSKAKSLKLSIDNQELSVGGKLKIIFKIEPSSVTNITYKDIEWTTDSENILKVNNGEVTGISVGTANVKAKIIGTDIIGNLDIKVTPQIIYGQIDQSMKAPDGLTIKINKIEISKNTDGTKYYNVFYNLKNENKDSKIMAGGFRLYKSDGKYIEQYGFFNYLYPGEQSSNSYTFKALSNESISFLEYRPDTFGGVYNSKIRFAIIQ